jgi:hypothetical protein
LLAKIEQLFGCDAADIAGASGDEYQGALSNRTGAKKKRSSAGRLSAPAERKRV